MDNGKNNKKSGVISNIKGVKGKFKGKNTSVINKNNTDSKPITSLDDLPECNLTDEDFKPFDVKKFQRKLAKYGITQEEWDEIDKYKGSAYFLPTTLLHRVNLFQYNMPKYGYALYNVDYLDPKKLLESYTKIYSAMCKFGKRDNEERNINRIGYREFYDEMNKSRQTESFLSFSKNEYELSFVEGKKDVVFCKGTLEKGAPCIDFSKLQGKDFEEEILVPPFLNINYENNSLTFDNYPELNVHISKDGNPASIDEKEAESLKALVINSDAPLKYYMHWYTSVKSNPSATGDDEISVKLREDFFRWQDNFKKYLQYRFREIENEINHPVITPIDFLEWVIPKLNKGFMPKMINVSTLFEDNQNKKGIEDEKDR